VLFKLVAHLSRSGLTDAVSIRDAVTDAAMVATVLGEHPHLITEPVGFSGLVARYQQMVAEIKKPPKKPRRGRPRKPADTPPRSVVWTSDNGVHHLHELTHPWHIEETDALGHCLGRPNHARWPGRDDDLFTLPYWRLIASCGSRLFSLGDTVGQLCTLHVTVSPPRLHQVQGHGREDVQSQPYYPALVEAVAQLASMFPGLCLNNYCWLQHRPGAPSRLRALTQQLAETVRWRAIRRHSS
jgi:hypothetical protein